MATRDFQDVTTTGTAPSTRGAKDIFVNILTTTGLVQRYVSASGARTRWSAPSPSGSACPATRARRSPSAGRQRRGQECVVAVTGRCSLGDHVTGTVGSPGDGTS